MEFLKLFVNEMETYKLESNSSKRIDELDTKPYMSGIGSLVR